MPAIDLNDLPALRETAHHEAGPFIGCASGGDPFLQGGEEAASGRLSERLGGRSVPFPPSITCS